MSKIPVLAWILLSVTLSVFKYSGKLASSLV